MYGGNMKVDLHRNEVRCDCGAVLYDGLLHKTYSQITIDGDIICPKCGAEETCIEGVI